MRSHEHKSDVDHTFLFNAVMTGQREVIFDLINTSPDVFFKPASTPVRCPPSRIFGPGTTLLQVLFWSSEPIRDEAIRRLSGTGFKKEVDAHRKAFSFTGLMTSTNGEEMLQKKQFSFSRIQTALKDNDFVTFRNELRNAPGWVPQVICYGDISSASCLSDLGRNKDLRFNDAEKTSWEDFLTKDVFCGLHWKGTTDGWSGAGRDTIRPLRKGEPNTPVPNSCWAFERLASLSFSAYKRFALETHQLEEVPPLTLPVIKSGIKIPDNFYCPLTGKFMKNPTLYLLDETSGWCHYELDALTEHVKKIYSAPLKPNTGTDRYPCAPRQCGGLLEDIQHFKALHPELFYDPVTLQELVIPPKNSPVVTVAGPTQQTSVPETKTPSESGRSSQFGVFGSSSPGTAEHNPQAASAPSATSAPPAIIPTPKKYLCAYTKKLMTNPVHYHVDDQIYDEQTLLNFLLDKKLSLVNAKIIDLSKLFTPLPKLREEIEAFREKNPLNAPTPTLHVRSGMSA